MRPLTLVAAGLVLVAVDVRSAQLDLVPDVLGWALVAAGAVRLGTRWVALAAAAAGVLSLADLHLPYRYLTVNPRTGELVEAAPGTGGGSGRHLAFDDLAGTRLVLVVVAVVAGGIALGLLAAALLRRARAAGDAPAARQLAVLRWLAPLAWSGPTVVLAVADAGSYDPIWNGSRELLALAGIGSVLWLAGVALWRTGTGWALPPVAPLRPLRGS